MKIRFRLLICLLLSPAATALAQVETAHPVIPEEVHQFDVDAISFSASDPALSRLDVFVRIPYEVLGFVQVDDGYTASYEISVNLLDSTGRLYTEKSWTEEIRTGSFDESVSRDSYSLVQQLLEAEPGEYTLVTTIRDLEIRTPMQESRPVLLRHYDRNSFSLSGIMLVSRISDDGGKKRIVPNVSPNVGTLQNGFHAFLEAYNWSGLEEIRTVTEILDENNKPVLTEEATHKLLAGRNQVFVRIDNKELLMGTYLLRITALDGDRQIAATIRPFVVRWFGMPLATKDLDAAIQQLQYIENGGEIDYIREAEDETEKRRRFIQFWEKRDPSPQTPRNEKMEEYYAKVEYANKHFAHYIEGWRTDMGMVYIIFGAPNNVERHPFDIDSKPYEIWSYYDLNHEFVFVDATGFGDYRLETPIWEIWQRPK